MKATIYELLRGPCEGPVTLHGWVRTSRFGKNVGFIHLFDGSTSQTVQVIVPKEMLPEVKGSVGVGTAIRVEGVWSDSIGPEQGEEVKAHTIEVVGGCDPAEYPIQKKEATPEFLRTVAHLRMRTAEYQSIFRVRNELSWNIHSYLQEHGFQWVHTPIITTSDCEGAGESFLVMTEKYTYGREGPYSHDFFGKPAFLTVSGQIEVEAFASAFTRVYSFGPTFRAENSNTARHASEFWMVEPEIAFADLDDLLQLIEEFVRVVGFNTLINCQLEVDKDYATALADRLLASETPFPRITYREAQEILAKSGQDFKYPIGWGTHLQTEHERFLAEEHFKGPVFVTDYPIEQKAFYMRVNGDGETVAATDLLVPGIGEIIGGSQREERLDKLDEQFTRFNLNPESYWWYRDLRRFGSVPHAGFGLGLERMLMWLTNTRNIRDVLPFPRTPGNAEF